MKWLRFCALTTAIAVVSMLAGPAGASVADFYKNKKINIYIGSTPGGGYDQYARLVGRHMGQYIPGKPSFVPKNMPGASGRRALSYVYTVAPKDGTAVGVVLRGTIFDPLFYPKKAIKVDATKITWIGSANSEVTTCVAWAATGIKSLDDLKTRGMIVGATGPNSTDTVFAKLLNRVAGTKIKVITGYPGSTQVHLAMERGEVDGRCGLGWDSIVARKQDWMRDKKINILVQLAMKPHKDLPNTLFAMTLARNDKAVNQSAGAHVVQGIRRYVRRHEYRFGRKQPGSAFDHKALTRRGKSLHDCRQWIVEQAACTDHVDGHGQFPLTDHATVFDVVQHQINQVWIIQHVFGFRAGCAGHVVKGLLCLLVQLRK